MPDCDTTSWPALIKWVVGVAFLAFVLWLFFGQRWGR